MQPSKNDRNYENGRQQKISQFRFWSEPTKYGDSTVGRGSFMPKEFAKNGHFWFYPLGLTYVARFSCPQSSLYQKSFIKSLVHAGQRPPSPPPSYPPSSSPAVCPGRRRPIRTVSGWAVSCRNHARQKNHARHNHMHVGILVSHNYQTRQSTMLILPGVGLKLRLWCGW